MMDNSTKERPDGSRKVAGRRVWMVIGLTVAAMAGLGLVAGWRHLEEIKQEGRLQSDIKVGRAIALVCRLYAEDWGGEFPAQLDLLYPGYVDALDILYDEQTGEPVWEYQPGLKVASPSETPLLWSREPWKGSEKYLVGYVGGQVRYETVQPRVDPELAPSKLMMELLEDHERSRHLKEIETFRLNAREGRGGYGNR